MAAVQTSEVEAIFIHFPLGSPLEHGPLSGFL
jgi:hypothetical protein